MLVQHCCCPDEEKEENDVEGQNQNKNQNHENESNDDNIRTCLNVTDLLECTLFRSWV